MIYYCRDQPYSVTFFKSFIELNENVVTPNDLRRSSKNGITSTQNLQRGKRFRSTGWGTLETGSEATITSSLALGKRVNPPKARDHYCL